MSNNLWIGVLEDQKSMYPKNVSYSLRSTVNNDSCRSLYEGETYLTECQCIGSDGGGLADSCLFKLKDAHGIKRYRSCSNRNCCKDKPGFVDKFGSCTCFDGEIWNEKCNRCCSGSETCDIKTKMCVRN